MNAAVVAAVVGVGLVVFAVWFRQSETPPATSPPAGSPGDLKRPAVTGGQEIVRPIAPVPVSARHQAPRGEPDGDGENAQPIVASEGHHLEADLNGGFIEVPDGFHLEFDVGAFTVEESAIGGRKRLRKRQMVRHV